VVVAAVAVDSAADAAIAKVAEKVAISIIVNS
jgi:hypothetical protein